MWHFRHNFHHTVIQHQNNTAIYSPHPTTIQWLTLNNLQYTSNTPFKSPQKSAIQFPQNTAITFLKNTTKYCYIILGGSNLLLGLQQLSSPPPPSTVNGGPELLSILQSTKTTQLWLPIYLRSSITHKWYCYRWYNGENVKNKFIRIYSLYIYIQLLMLMTLVAGALCLDRRSCA